MGTVSAPISARSYLKKDRVFKLIPVKRKRERLEEQKPQQKPVCPEKEKGIVDLVKQKLLEKKKDSRAAPQRKAAKSKLAKR